MLKAVLKQLKRWTLAAVNTLTMLRSLALLVIEGRKQLVLTRFWTDEEFCSRFANWGYGLRAAIFSTAERAERHARIFAKMLVVLPLLILSVWLTLEAEDPDSPFLPVRESQPPETRIRLTVPTYC